MNKSSLTVYLFVALSAAACASTTQTAPAPAPTPTTEPAAPTAAQETPAEPTPAPAPEELTLERAKAIVTEIQAEWPLKTDDPLLSPKSLADAEKVMKLDQITLFPTAIQYLETQDSVQALAVRGQIELAWGEAYVILVDLMRTLHGRIKEEATVLKTRSEMAPLSEKEAADLEEMQDSCDLLERTGPAFAMLIVEHLTAGEKAATEAIEKSPKSYLGYRVSADYYRLMEDWENFRLMLAEVKKRKPDSNGLRFLKGAEAFQSKNDRTAATAFYKDALAKDPAFVRAQSHLLMIQPDIKGLHTELEKLRKLNPNHQIVAWVGAMIDQAYESWKKRNGFLAN